MKIVRDKILKMYNYELDIIIRNIFLRRCLLFGLIIAL